MGAARLVRLVTGLSIRSIRYPFGILLLASSVLCGAFQGSIVLTDQLAVEADVRVTIAEPPDEDRARVVMHDIQLVRRSASDCDSASRDKTVNLQAVVVLAVAVLG